jgi:OOP family OmpA-OmpF porin
MKVALLRSIAWVTAWVVALTWLPLAVRADARLLGGGMDLHLFRPVVDSKGHISVNGTDVLGAGDISFGLILDGGFGILPFNGFVNDPQVLAADAQQVDQITKQFFTGTFHFNVGIANRFAVGLQLPVQVVNSYQTTVPGVFNDPASNAVDYQGLGNLSLHAKWRIWRAPYDIAGLGALLQVQLPTGSPEQFAGDPGLALWPMLLGQWNPVRPLRFNLNLGYRFVGGEGATFPVNGTAVPGSPAGNATLATLTRTGNPIQYDDLITGGVAASYRLFRPLDVVAEYYAVQLANELGNRRAYSSEALAGLKIFVERNSYLMVGGGIGIGEGFSSADYRAVLGFVFEPSIGDRDGDGIKDDVDQCPDDPEDWDQFQDTDGCPDPDNDKDGILDVNDACPLVPEDFDGDEDEDGCPEGDEGDRDGDGIPDSLDKCPDDPEDRDGFEDEDGCPDPDNDKDGILDKDDLCPNDPEDKDGFQDQDGCPDPDNDNDRILDKNDACPNDPETYNGFQDQDGCPDKGLVVVEENQILILEKIYFETDSAEIMQRSFPLLDAVAATLNGNPQIKRIEIQGHADERGSDAYNLKLTRARAASVREALVQRGVDPGRIRSAGYGERCPVDPGHNEVAWEKNRRVEFKILETDQGPTGVEVACPAARSLIPKD